MHLSFIFFPFWIAFLLHILFQQWSNHAEDVGICDLLPSTSVYVFQYVYISISETDWSSFWKTSYFIVWGIYDLKRW